MEAITPAAQTLEHSVRALLAGFDDPTREGLVDTPRRYVRFLEEFLNPPEFSFTTFESEGYDQMIIQTDIPFYSLCEHHLAPFFGVGHIAYIPKERIVGLSKLARTLDKFARRFQNQERITKQVAEFLEQQLEPVGVAVCLKAQHLCMAMRGVKKHDTWTITSELTGCFREDAASRAEFLALTR
jgi:GTP cyclohydrolase IA